MPPPSPSHTSIHQHTHLSSVCVCVYNKYCTGKRVCVSVWAARVCNITAGYIRKISFSTSPCTLICAPSYDESDNPAQSFAFMHALKAL